MSQAPDASAPRPAPLSRQLAAGLVPTFLLALLSYALPEIALDTSFADAVVVLTDTTYWGQLPIISGVVMLLIVSRAGLSARRRMVEAGSMIGAMLVVLLAWALVNEHLIKPAIASPRPNIVALAEAGELGVGSPDAFYALGDKDERRDHLRELYEGPEPPDEVALSPRVREHWIHETGYSFPSGHSTAAMTFATMMFAVGLAWLSGWRRMLTNLLPVWALGVVYSRPLLRVHRASDVSVGALAGITLGLLAFAAISWLVKRVPDEPAETRA